jgi:taurine dioxygenase
MSGISFFMSDRITVHRVSGALGAELRGVDLAAALDAATVAALRGALLEHGVIFFRDQALDAAQHKALARCFGGIFRHPNLLGAGDDPDVILIRREPGDKRIIGEDWHSDTPQVAEPPMGSILYALETPPQGGDTLFANQYLAYETLSPGLQRLLAGLRAIHSDRRIAGPGHGFNRERATKTREDAAWRETVSTHPVVRTHPETGRKALYVNRMSTVGFAGMSEAESAPLLRYLCAHGHRPEFTCRFRWRPGSIAFWDNRCTQHMAVNDAGPFRRVMRRIQLAGDRPR